MALVPQTQQHPTAGCAFCYFRFIVLWHKCTVSSDLTFPPCRSPCAMVSPAVIPAQMVFSYTDSGTRCELHFAFAADGAAPLVALRLRHPNGDGSWSGWHGSWQLQNGRMNADVHWRGARSQRLRRLVFHQVHSRFFIWYQWGNQASVHVRMTTDLPARRMLCEQTELSDWTLV